MTIVLSLEYQKTPIGLYLGTPSRVKVGTVIIGGPGPTGPTGPTGPIGPAGGVDSVNGETGVLTGFAKTADLGTAAALDTGTSSGNIPVLGVGGLLDTAVLPSVAITDVFVVASQAAMLALTAQKGDIAVRTDINKSFALSTNAPGTLAGWKELLTPTDIVLSVAGLTGAISASALRSALTLVVGTDVQAYSAILAAVAGLTGAANDDVIQKKAGVFTNRTPAQLLADIVASALGTVTIPGTSSTAAGIRLAEDTDNGTNYIGLRAPASIAANKDFILPSADGFAGDAIVTDGAGNLSFNQLATMDPADISTVRPTLDLDFTSPYGAPFAGNLTRSTAGGYRMNSKGVLVPTVANEPVIDFGSDGVARGTGFNTAYTNLLTYSEQFENAAWTKQRVTVTADAITAPDGVSSADKVVEAVTAGPSYIAQSYTFSAAVYTWSVYVKAAEKTVLDIYLTDSVGTISNARAAVDLSAGTISLVGGTGRIDPLPNGWFFVTATTSSPIAAGAGALRILLAAPDLDDGTSGLYLWGAQLTATAFPVPYVPTTSATVTRNADSMVDTSISEWFNPVEGAVYVEGYAPRAVTGFPASFYVSDNTYNNRHLIYYDGVNQTIVGLTTTGGVAQASLSASLTRGSLFRAAYSYKTNNFLFSLNGATALSDVSGTMPTGISRLNIGADHAGAGQWSECIRRIIYWPKALTSTELQRMTA